MLDEETQDTFEGEGNRLAIHEGQQRHAECLLHWRQPEQARQHSFRLHVACQLDDDAHAGTVALVPQVGDTIDLAIPYEQGDALQKIGLVRLIGKLGHDDPAAAAAHLLKMSLGLHDQSRPAGGISLGDGVDFLFAFGALAIAEKDAAGGEVRPFNELQKIIDADFVYFIEVIDQIDGGVNDFGQIVGGNVGRHAHGDAIGAVDEKVGQCGRQDARLLERGIKVVGPVDRVLLDIRQHQIADGCQARFGIAHGRGVVTVDRAEVALAIDQRVAQAELLRHTHHGVIDGGIVVGMILAQHFADDTGALLVGFVAGQPHIVHSIEDTSMHRFEAVAHVGQSAGDDDAHGIVKICGVHLSGDIDLADGSYHFTCLLFDQGVNSRVERGGDLGQGGSGARFVSPLDIGQVSEGCLPVLCERSRSVLPKSLLSALPLCYMSAKFGRRGCGFAVNDGHSHFVRDATADFRMECGQPVPQFAFVVEQRLILRTAFVFLPPFKNVRIQRTSRQGGRRQLCITKGRPVSFCHWMSVSGVEETF